MGKWNMLRLTKNRQFMTKVVALGLLGVVTTFQACGRGDLGVTEQSSLEERGLNLGDSYVPGDGGMISAEATKTVGVNYSEQLLTSLVSVSGIGQPSNRTLNVYRNETNKIAETGTADSVNAPMWLAITNLSGEVCWDLIQQERALPADQRRIFKQVDFTKGPQLVTDAAKDDVIRRLARSAWARNETAEESALIKTAVASAFAAGTSTDETNRSMLYTCTAIMASLDTHDR